MCFMVSVKKNHVLFMLTHAARDFFDDGNDCSG